MAEQGVARRGQGGVRQTILTDQLTLSQPWVADYAHHITYCVYHIIHNYAFNSTYVRLTAALRKN